MLNAWLRSMLGPFTAVLDYFSANPERLSIILVIWAVTYFIGLLQLKRIEAKTTAMVLKESATQLKTSPNATADDLYKKIYPLWTVEFKKWKYLYIPHKHDVWPVRVTEENVFAKIPFSPEWISAVLIKNGITIN